MSKVTADFAFMLNELLTMNALREKILREPLFKQARKKLGPIDAERCYTVNPLPALGGSFKPAALRIGKLREYLAIAAQV